MDSKGMYSVLEALSDGEEASSRQVAKRAEMEPRTVRRMLSDLQISGCVILNTKKDPESFATIWRYEITAKGVDRCRYLKEKRPWES